MVMCWNIYNGVNSFLTKLTDCVKTTSIRLKDAKHVLAKWLGPQEDDEIMTHIEDLLYIEDGLA